MGSQTQRSGDAFLVRQYDREGGFDVVADVGAGRSDVSADVLSDRVILVAERDEGDVEREFELPDAATAEAFIRNGVVTIEVRE